MTTFAKKTMNVAEWASVQNRIGEIQIARGGPHDLMMFSVDRDDDVTRQDIYLGLPDTIPLSTFHGFEQIERESLPDYLATLVVGRTALASYSPTSRRSAALNTGKQATQLSAVGRLG